MPSDNPSHLKWKNLDGRQKYEVVELARRQEIPVTELCATFGVSRQTLYRAIEAADQASVQALSPKPKGRPPTPVTEKEIRGLRKRNQELEQDLRKQKLKNEIAQAFLDLQRKVERGERLPGEKKSDWMRRQSSSIGSGPARPHPRVAGDDDG